MPDKSDKTIHKWTFASRFRRHAFGWRSRLPAKRVKEAVSEIKKVARKDPVLGAEGAVLFLEKVSPALEHVDSSSGVLGSAVDKAVAALVDVIASAEVDFTTRRKWLERLYLAHEEDRIPYIECLGDFWGELCVTPDLASFWADELLSTTRMALSPDPELRGFFHGTIACLSALFAAGRHQEIVDLLGEREIWHYQRWKVRALAAMGKTDEALTFAESCRHQSTSDYWIDMECEEVLLASGRTEEAYRRYGLNANRSGTYVGWLRAVARKYPDRDPADILKDLIDLTPFEEGKWFAAAKSIGLYDEAIALANTSPTSPQTLTRAARDFSGDRPEFALEAGLAALKWLARGYGYDVTYVDVAEAVAYTLDAAKGAGRTESVLKRITQIAKEESQQETFVTKAILAQLASRT